MGGTKEGAQKARDKNISKHGADFYKRIGAMGGKVGRTGGFYANRELARAAGAKGGATSRRQPGSSKVAKWRRAKQEKAEQ